jgi:RNA polymerase sigma-70 factor, ECF subfamily
VTTLLSGGTRNNQASDDDVDLVRDRELVTRAQAGDLAAFDDLYRRYRRRLHRLCVRRLQDSHEAEDVVQEAFARAWRALPNFGGDRRFYPWLTVIAAHLCTDVQRRRNRSTPVAEFHQADVASVEDGGEEAALAAADHELVAKAFARLSDRHRRVLELREGSGWSYQRIADHEGVGITAVETLLWRARQALKREFAALAGSEGPAGVAVFATGLLSVAGLRRLMGAMGRGARRMAGAAAHGPTVIMGSAAAATAMVVAASVSSPGALAPTPQHLGTHGNAANSALTVPGVGGAGAGAADVSGLGGNVPGSNAPGTGAASTTGGTGSGTGNPSGTGSGTGVVSGLPTVAGSVVGGLSGAASGTITGVVNGITGAVGALGSTVDSLGSTVGTLGSAASNVVGQVGSTVTGATSSILNQVTPLLSTVVGAGDATTPTGAGSASSSSTGSSSTSTSTPSASSGVAKVPSGVGTAVHQLSSAGNQLLGGL